MYSLDGQWCCFSGHDAKTSFLYVLRHQMSFFGINHHGWKNRIIDSPHGISGLSSLGVMAHPDFDRSVNPISTRERRIVLTKLLLEHPNFQTFRRPVYAVLRQVHVMNYIYDLFKKPWSWKSNTCVNNFCKFLWFLTEHSEYLSIGRKLHKCTNSVARDIEMQTVINWWCGPIDIARTI